VYEDSGDPGKDKSYRAAENISPDGITSFRMIKELLNKNCRVEKM
tara:strand:+ start:222069 stop:222203 length:135 start_codon:yes stop_codon:yes gene_type:complete